MSSSCGECATEHSATAPGTSATATAQASAVAPTATEPARWPRSTSRPAHGRTDTRCSLGSVTPRPGINLVLSHGGCHRGRCSWLTEQGCGRPPGDDPQMIGMGLRAIVRPNAIYYILGVADGGSPRSGDEALVDIASRGCVSAASDTQLAASPVAGPRARTD